MTEEEKWGLVRKTLLQLETQDTIVAKTERFLGLSYDNSITAPYKHCKDSAIALCAALVEDSNTDSWIEWYVFENNYGKKQFEAGYPKVQPSKAICNFNDLREVIEIGRRLDMKE